MAEKAGGPLGRASLPNEQADGEARRRTDGPPRLHCREDGRGSFRARHPRGGARPPHRRRPKAPVAGAQRGARNAGRRVREAVRGAAGRAGFLRARGAPRRSVGKGGPLDGSSFDLGIAAAGAGPAPCCGARGRSPAAGTPRRPGRCARCGSRRRSPSSRGRRCRGTSRGTRAPSRALPRRSPSSDPTSPLRPARAIPRRASRPPMC